jgi:methylmalonyl-CoA/ethylmalonyl-CoA epimerase
MKFHHIGVVCKDLELETRQFALLGYVPYGPDFTDEIQGVKGRFLTGGGPQIELLTSIGKSGVLEPWLKAGVKMYHLCYETPDLSSEIAHLQNERAKLVAPPAVSNAFDGRKIAFLALSNLLLVELIEAPVNDQ